MQTQAHKVRVSKHFFMFLMFLAFWAGKETQLVANPDMSDFSTRRHTMSEQERDSIMNNAPFVLEGRIIKSAFYGYFDKSHLFEIEKVYRGGERLQAGTVEIIVVMPDYMTNETEPVSFQNEWCLLFAKEIDSVGIFDANNAIKLELYSDKSNNHSYFVERYGRYLGLSINFVTKEDLQNFLATSYNLYPKDIPKADTLKTVSRKEIEKAKIEEQRKSQEKIIPYVSPEKADSILREINRRQRLEWDTIQNKKQ